MIAFIFGFWVGAVVVGGGIWLGTHPNDRSAIFSKVRALFAKKDEPK